MDVFSAVGLPSANSPVYPLLIQARVGLRGGGPHSPFR